MARPSSTSTNLLRPNPNTRPFLKIMAREKKLPPPTPSEAAVERLLEQFAAPAPARPRAEAPPEASAFLDELYATARVFLERDQYATIGAASGFNTKVVGVSFEGRQDVVASLRPGETVELRRHPDNAFDADAIGVWFGTLQLGFLKAAIAARVAPNMDAGERYAAEVTAVTGGGERSFGINIYVTRVREPPPAARTQRAAAARADVLHALIGEQPLREAQRAVLERLDAGRNTLAVMG